jgi:hypothetical protein
MRRKSSLGRGRRNKRRYLGRDHRGYVRGSNQIGDGDGLRGMRPARTNVATTTAANGLEAFTPQLLSSCPPTQFALGLRFSAASGARHVKVR